MSQNFTTMKSSPESKEATPRVLFIGNSPNRLNPGNPDVSWDSILSEFLKNINVDGGDKSDAEKLKKLPFPVITEMWQNLNNDDAAETKEEEWGKMLDSLKELTPCGLHARLVSLVKEGHFQQILTTNYDYCFEKALGKKYPDQIATDNLHRHNGEVWHLHGEADCKDSIVMSGKEYLEAVKSMPDRPEDVEKDVWKDTWLYHFLHSDVVVCGFEPRHEELLFWKALRLRMMLPEEKRNNVCVYLFDRNDGRDELWCPLLSPVGADSEGKGGTVYSTDAVNMRLLFRSMGVNCEIISVKPAGRLEDWSAAWCTLLGKILTKGGGDKDKSISPAKPTNPIVTVPFKSRDSKNNIVASASPTLMNPDRCWLNIATWKLDQLSESGSNDEVKHYLFDTMINGIRRTYHAPVQKIKDAFEKHDTDIIANGKYTRYSFYLDYRTGEIYNKVSENDTNPILTLKRVKNDDEFLELRIALPKQ